MKRISFILFFTLSSIPLFSGSLESLIKAYDKNIKSALQSSENYILTIQSQKKGLFYDEDKQPSKALKKYLITSKDEFLSKLSGDEFIQEKSKNGKDEFIYLGLGEPIGKGGFGIGGAYGKGTLYENGILVGDAKMTQVSVGFQWGGQSYSELIVFENKKALELFKSSRLELAAQASAIAVTAGVSADVPYTNGVAVYTLPKAGLMYEATVGGQKFKYFPENESESDDI